MLFKKEANSKYNYIIAGLGNPGDKYENTRHNVGFAAIDKIAEEYGVKVNKIKFKALIGEIEYKDKKVLLMKPTTFMNNSGEAVREAMNFYKIKPENVIVIFDDISLDPGKMRLRKKGSCGGHNGIRSIIDLNSSDNFPRIKIGVGKKPHPEYDLAAWVLSKPIDSDRKLIDEVCKKCVGAAESIMDGDFEKAMNIYNR
ncbi:MAG: aminoacyl-tRNA hydrolase [Ruminococcaceae bacterium]|nr:aminoacyl-tRNA hydrolase [Oscillospiraceae bacterium]